MALEKLGFLVYPNRSAAIGQPPNWIRRTSLLFGCSQFGYPMASLPLQRRSGSKDSRYQSFSKGWKTGDGRLKARSKADRGSGKDRWASSLWPAHPGIRQVIRQRICPVPEDLPSARKFAQCQKICPAIDQAIASFRSKSNRNPWIYSSVQSGP